MNEHLLFDIPDGPKPPRPLPVPGAHSHANDPVSSDLAAEQFTKTGTLAKHQAIVLDGVHRCPGGTGAEIAEGIPELKELQVLRRLSELADAKLIRRGELGFCRIRQRRCLTWWPTEAEAES